MITCICPEIMIHHFRRYFKGFADINEWFIVVGEKRWEGKIIFRDMNVRLINKEIS